MADKILAVFKSNILSLVAGLFALPFFFSCNPVKRVLSSEKMTEKVVLEWRKTNPPDTGKTIYLPGTDTVIVKDTTIYRTITVPGGKEKIVETRYVDRLKTDTVRQYVYDTAMVNIALRRIAALDDRVEELEGDLKRARGENWGWRFLMALAVIISVVAFVRKK